MIYSDNFHIIGADKPHKLALYKNMWLRVPTWTAYLTIDTDGWVYAWRHWPILIRSGNLEWIWRSSKVYDTVGRDFMPICVMPKGTKWNTTKSLRKVNRVRG